MSSVLMDKLIATALSRGANGLCLSAGYPPTLFVRGEMVDLETKTLTQDDVDSVGRNLSLDGTNDRALLTSRKDHGGHSRRLPGSGL